MAKLNLSYQTTATENPLAFPILGSVGFLMCLVVTVMGIKLWWFKHRLSFEQTTIQNGTAGGVSPSVVVTRRQKKSKFSKDKRWSQQIYSSVDVHGVFKQRKDDDLDIQRPSQLPPIRPKETDRESKLLLTAPPRNKRRPQYVQSTAFEELGDNYDYSKPPSPSLQTQTNLNIPSLAHILDTPRKEEGISLTFEEVDKELKSPYVGVENTSISLEIAPEPPKRLNRSSSANLKPEHQQEKTHHFLKSSQSISVPEFRKVIERRPTGFHRPTEDDLTKIDDLEESPFEKFGDRRPTGYIKYEEVDFEADLRDFRELSINGSEDDVQTFYDSGHLENKNMRVEPIEALRNEEIIYQNPVSPDITEINKSIEDYERLSTYANKTDELTKYSNCSYNNFSKWKPPSYTYEYEGISGTESTGNDSTNIQDNTKVNGNLKEAKETGYISEHNIPVGNSGDHASDHAILQRSEDPQIWQNTNPNQRIVSFENNFDEIEDMETYSLNQRRPTAYVRNIPTEESEDLTVFRDTENIPRTKPSTSPSHEFQTMDYAYISPSELHSQNVRFQTDDVVEKFTLNQRRPTKFVKTVSTPSIETAPRPQTVNFEENSCVMEDKFTLNQRRPTAFIRSEDVIKSPQTVTFDVNSYQMDSNEDKFTLNQRRPTEFVRSAEHSPTEEVSMNTHSTVAFEANSYQEEGHEEFASNQLTIYDRSYLKNEENAYEEVPVKQQTVRFEINTRTDQMEGDEDKFTLNQRRPTSFAHFETAEFHDNIQQPEVMCDFEENSHGNLTPNQTTYSKDRIISNPTFDNQYQDMTENPLVSNRSESVEQYDVTDGLVKNVKEECTLQTTGPIPRARKPRTDTAEKDADTVWQELEKSLELDFAQNVEEEFARIRQSFELNEGDFLEIKDELQLSSPTLFVPDIQSPTGFGKSIEDDWENFEKLNKVSENKSIESMPHQQGIRITYNKNSEDHNVTTVVSILKETKQETSKPRKSKVTFDSKTEERLIPARKSPSDEEDTDDYNDDNEDDSIYTKLPPPIPMQRFVSLYHADERVYEPVVSPPNNISLFGSQISDESEVAELEDSWSAIKKHRSLTSQFQSLTLDSPTSPPPPSHPPPPLPSENDFEIVPAPKPAYRNPLAQLAVERAREVRSDMEGFKGRSIRDAKKMQAKRSSQEILKLNADFDDTEA